MFLRFLDECLETEAKFDECRVVLLCRTFVVYNRTEHQFDDITFRDREMYFRKVAIMGGHIFEILLVVLAGLAIFGPKTLQSLGRNAGKGIGQAKEIKDKIMSELPMEEIHTISQNIPTSPRHAVQILMTPEQKERVKASAEQKSQAASESVQPTSESKPQ